MDQSDDITGQWRYLGVGENTWMLDQLSGNVYNPESKIIAALDGGDLDGFTEPTENLHDVLPTILIDRERSVVEGYLFNGRSMADLGKSYKVTRQRVWQIYKQALEKVKGYCDGDMNLFRKLFIGEEA